ncbi:hypothetical protein AX17_005779 [Amanita inopinata Kibby_2008]|nr:hypothetical protein AX17_005779 [Amanita inopinata Kibby_2008]
MHYRSDHHRYNMKRRVAGLPPVSASVFDEKVLERRQQTAATAPPKDYTCALCNKVYTTENAHRSHLQSKRHKENEFKAASKSASAALSNTNLVTTKATAFGEPVTYSARPVSSEGITIDDHLASLAISNGVTEDETEAIDQKIAAARYRLSASDCLFCAHAEASLEANLTHMSTSHSFFLPDVEYLVDLPGLLVYLGEKVAVGNICVYCNGKSREFRTLNAVRKHMLDKSHCKIAYETEQDRLEISDFYDFTTSYPDAESRRMEDRRRDEKDENEEWEDVEDDDPELDVDEVVEEQSGGSSEDADDDALPNNHITYGDTEFELVLPSGARIGHRSMRRYYAQSFHSVIRGDEQVEGANSGVALVRRLLADKNAALVPRRGGYGAFGMGTAVVKARNPGEARNAGRHIREHRDQKRREEFKTRIAFRHNHQKHYRDPLLQ